MSQETHSTLGKPKPSDPVWCARVLRPASAPLIRVAHRMGMSANTVSLAMLPLILLAAILIGAGDVWLALMGALIMNFVALGDCVDGGVARLSGATGPAGEWMDAMVGYTVYAVLPLAIGFRAWHAEGPGTGILGPEVLFLLGAATAVLNLYARVLYQKYLNAFQDRIQSEEANAGKGSLYSKVMTQLGFVGLMMPLLLLAVVTGTEALYVMLYFAVYAVSALGTAVILIRRVLSGEG